MNFIVSVLKCIDRHQEKQCVAIGPYTTIMQKNKVRNLWIIQVAPCSNLTQTVSNKTTEEYCTVVGGHHNNCGGSVCEQKEVGQEEDGRGKDTSDQNI